MTDAWTGFMVVARSSVGATDFDDDRSGRATRFQVLPGLDKTSIR